MAVTFTNNWKNILDKLESILEAEFKGALPVYKGNSVPKGVNQALKLTPLSSVLNEYNTNSETREFTVSVQFIFAEANIRETALDHVLRYVSRIEALVHDNITMTLSDSTNAFNCRFESTNLNTDEDSGVYLVDWEYKCQHLGNTD
tara:strand:- start:1267 stop:1704 length:438 start_codon:yes stop_codon:yes gene_type:complete